MILSVTNISSLFNFLILCRDKNDIVNKIKTFINLLINSLGFIIIKYINIFMSEIHLKIIRTIDLYHG